MLNRVGATAKAVSTQWTAVGGGAGTTVAPVMINEYGAIYDYTELNNVPANSVTPWYAPGSNVDGDYGPFGGLSEHTEGIYIAIKGSEDDTYREGILVAYRADGEKGMAYCHLSGGPGIGGVASDKDWMVVTPPSTENLIPGYKILASKWPHIIREESDVTYKVTFNRPVSKSAKLLVTGELHQSQSSSSDVILNIPIAPVNVSSSTGRGALVEFSSGFLSVTSNPAFIRFLVTSPTVDAQGKVTALNINFQSVNLSPNSEYYLALDIYANE